MSTEDRCLTEAEFANLRKAWFDGGIFQGRKEERQEMAKRLSAVRYNAESAGGVWRLPVIMPVTVPGGVTREDACVTFAEFTTNQLRALEVMFCGVLTND